MTIFTHAVLLQNIFNKLNTMYFQSKLGILDIIHHLQFQNKAKDLMMLPNTIEH